VPYVRMISDGKNEHESGRGRDLCCACDLTERACSENTGHEQSFRGRFPQACQAYMKH